MYDFNFYVCEGSLLITRLKAGLIAIEIDNTDTHYTNHQGKRSEHLCPLHDGLKLTWLVKSSVRENVLYEANLPFTEKQHRTK